MTTGFFLLLTNRSRKYLAGFLDRKFSTVRDHIPSTSFLRRGSSLTRFGQRGRWTEGEPVVVVHFSLAILKTCSALRLFAPTVFPFRNGVQKALYCPPLQRCKPTTVVLLTFSPGAGDRGHRSRQNTLLRLGRDTGSRASPTLQKN